MSAKSHENKIDGRFNDTRQRLLQKAKEMYYQKGYTGISLQELADSVGITKAALFHHFKSKQELFFEVQLAICENYRTAIEAAIQGGSDTRSRLHNILLGLSDYPFFDPMKFMSDEYHQLNTAQQSEIDRTFTTSTILPVQQVLLEGIRNGEIKIRNQHLAVSIFLNLTMLLPSSGNPVVEVMPPDKHEAYIEDLLEIFWSGIGISD